MNTLLTGNMKLPNWQNAEIAQKKITEYILSPTHVTGYGKAKFFTHCGFSSQNWELLAQAFLNHAQTHEVAKAEETPFGTRFVVEGSLKTPNSQNPFVRVVWFINTNEEIPRFVTAYPQKEDEKRNDP
jgi:hypothetical protein